MSDRAADEPSTDEGDGETAATAAEAESGDGTDEEWEFSLEDIEAREDEKQAAAAAAEASREPIQPGNPTLEGVTFVLLGVVAAAYILSRLFV